MKKLESLDPDEMMRSADEIGRDLSRGRNSVKHAQVRHILDEVNRIRLEIRKRQGDLPGDLLARIKLLKPRFAYLAGRANSLKPLYSVLSPMIDKTRDRHDFDRFAEFVQAIVAYHKFHGGSDR
ncbi:MAG TPA: type III-A CRISPR-associated protein Csm2 [Thermaerobacter sp.]